MPRAWLAWFAPLLWSACQSRGVRVEHASVADLLARGRLFEAEAVLREDRRDPLAYAELVLERDDLPEAEQRAGDALRADSGNRRAQLILARARERYGDFAQAVPVLQKLGDQVWLCRAALDANRDPHLCAALRETGALEAVSAYAAWLLHAAQPEAAEAVLRGALAGVPERGPQIRTVSRLHYELGLALRDRQQPIAAEAEFWRALAIQREVLGGSLYIADTLFALGAMKLDQGWPASFQPFLREALEIRSHLLDSSDWRVAQARGAVAACLSAERRFEGAGADLRQAYAAVARERGPEAPETVQLQAWREAHQKRLAFPR